jgi:WXG100 family type VII secretion target
MSYTVSLDDLAHVVDRMAAFDRSLRAALDDIDARVRTLAVTWTGPAAASYAEAHRRWRGDLRRMAGAVEHLRHVAATAHGNYAAALAANRAMWR